MICLRQFCVNVWDIARGTVLICQTRHVLGTLVYVMPLAEVYVGILESHGIGVGWDFGRYLSSVLHTCAVFLTRLLILRERLHKWVHSFPQLLIDLGFSSYQAKMFFPLICTHWSFSCSLWHVICRPLAALFASAGLTPGHSSELCLEFPLSIWMEVLARYVWETSSPS